MGKRILTNKFNLPKTLVQAVALDTHRVSGTISVTTLIDSPQIRMLKSKHDYEVDVSEGIYALMGTALHSVLERGNMPSVRQRAFILTAETLAEKAKEYAEAYPDKASQLNNGSSWLFSLVQAFFPETEQTLIFEKMLQLDCGDHIISGTFDLYDKETGILYDYKFCSTFNYVYPEGMKKWEEQTNIYAYMLRMNGYHVNGIRIVAFFRDWSEQRLMSTRGYPERQIMEIPISLKSDGEVKSAIDWHLNRHRASEAGDPVECDGRDRWATSDVYAVMKTDKSGKVGKRAEKLHVSHVEAQYWIDENKHKYLDTKLVIQRRPGESRRCAKYCPVNKFCAQYKEEQERKAMQGE